MAKPDASTNFTAERQVKHASLRVKHKGKPVSNEDLVEAIWSLREELAEIIARAAARVDSEPETAAKDDTAPDSGPESGPGIGNDALLEQMSALRAEMGSMIGSALAGSPGDAAPDIDGLKQEIAALRGDISTIVQDALANAAPAAPAAPAEPAAEAAPAKAKDDPDDKFNAQDVRLEIAQMVRTIARAKNEIAAISQPTKDDDDRLDRASNELDAIVTATETATRDILMSNEEIGTLIDEIAIICTDNSEITQRTERVAELMITIFEACSFQDITGQRITKVVRTLQFIQDRILAMIEIWGIDAFSDLPVSLPGQDDGLDDDAKLLNGPQLENEGITQAEIDALFD